MMAAKRGDLALFELESAHQSYVHGRSERVCSYLFAKVTSVTLAGMIKRAERPKELPWPWFLGSANSLVVPASMLNGKTADELLLRLGEHFICVDQARDALRALLRAATAENFAALVTSTEARVRAIP